MIYIGRGNIGLAIAICALPISIASEYTLRERERHDRISWGVFLRRTLLLIACSIVPAFAAQRGMRDGNQFIPAHGLTYFWCDWLLKWTSNWSSFAWPPAVVVFLSLSFPILTNRNLSNLPLRSVMLLTIFTASSAIFLVALIYTYLKEPPNSYDYIPLAINVISILYLWRSWHSLRNRFGPVQIVLWNMAFSTWLFWIAHPWLGEFPRIISGGHAE